jgi:hypothetical protein
LLSVVKGSDLIMQIAPEPVHDNPLRLAYEIAGQFSRALLDIIHLRCPNGVRRVASDWFNSIGRVATAIIDVWAPAAAKPLG